MGFRSNGGVLICAFVFAPATSVRANCEISDAQIVQFRSAFQAVIDQSSSARERWAERGFAGDAAARDNFVVVYFSSLGHVQRVQGTIDLIRQDIQSPDTSTAERARITSEMTRLESAVAPLRGYASCLNRQIRHFNVTSRDCSPPPRPRRREEDRLAAAMTEIRRRAPEATERWRTDGFRGSEAARRRFVRGMSVRYVQRLRSWSTGARTRAIQDLSAPDVDQRSPERTIRETDELLTALRPFYVRESCRALTAYCLGQGSYTPEEGEQFSEIILQLNPGGRQTASGAPLVCQTFGGSSVAVADEATADIPTAAGRSPGRPPRRSGSASSRSQ